MAHPKSCSHIQLIATPALQTLNNTRHCSALFQSTVPTRHQWMCFCCLTAHTEISACGTGTLLQPGVSSAGPRWTGLWAFPMSPSQCKPFTDGIVRALGFTVTTELASRPVFPTRRMFLLQHFKCQGPDAVGKADVSREPLGKATATNLSAEHRLHRHWEIFLDTLGTSVHHLAGAKEANLKSL